MRSSGTGGNLMVSLVTITVPGPISATSAAAVSGFITTRISWPPRRATQPSRLARIVNHVGSPAMFDGNRFFPLTGMPIWKMARSSTLFAVWLPEPLTVATWMLKSLTTGFKLSHLRGRGRSWEPGAAHRHEPEADGSGGRAEGQARPAGRRRQAPRAASDPSVSILPQRLEHLLVRGELDPRPAVR